MVVHSRRIMELPPSVKMHLYVHAKRLGMSEEELLRRILAGEDLLPSHISELIRRAHGS